MCTSPAAVIKGTFTTFIQDNVAAESTQHPYTPHTVHARPHTVYCVLSQLLPTPSVDRPSVFCCAWQEEQVNTAASKSLETFIVILYVLNTDTATTPKRVYKD